MFELRRYSSYRGSSYGDSTVLSQTKVGCDYKKGPLNHGFNPILPTLSNVSTCMRKSFAYKFDLQALLIQSLAYMVSLINFHYQLYM